MPSMAPITVLDAVGASVTYVPKTPSAGDKSPAVWTQDGLSDVIGWRPKFQVQTRNNGSNNGRIVEGTMSYVVFDIPNNLKLATIPFSFNATIPTNVDYLFAQDASVQFGNLLVSALMREVFDTGYAPT